MDKMYSEEYFRKIHRENTYIIMEALCVLSLGLNISEEAREVCLKTANDLYNMVGDEDIIIKVNLGD